MRAVRSRRVSLPTRPADHSEQVQDTSSLPEPSAGYDLTARRLTEMSEASLPYCPRCSEERLRVNELDLLECPHCHTQAQRIDRVGGLHVLDRKGNGHFREPPRG